MKIEFLKTKKDKTIAIIIAVLFVAVLVLTGVLIGTNQKDSTHATDLGFKDIGRLQTQEAIVTVVKDKSKSRDFFKLFNIPFTESRILFSYKFSVTASLDFSKVEIAKIDDKNKTIDVKIPYTEIDKDRVSQNNNSLVVYIDEESIFSRIKLEEQNKAMQEMKDEAIRQAEDGGILIKADNNAKTLISQMIKNNGQYKKYKINFTVIE